MLFTALLFSVMTIIIQYFIQYIIENQASLLCSNLGLAILGALPHEYQRKPRLGSKNQSFAFLKAFL